MHLEPNIASNLILKSKKAQLLKILTKRSKNEISKQKMSRTNKFDVKTYLFANRPKRVVPKFRADRSHVRGVNGRSKFVVAVRPRREARSVSAASRRESRACQISSPNSCQVLCAPTFRLQNTSSKLWAQESFLKCLPPILCSFPRTRTDRRTSSAVCS